MQRIFWHYDKRRKKYFQVETIKKDATDKDIRNLFRLRKRCIRKSFVPEEVENYFKLVRVGKF